MTLLEQYYNIKKQYESFLVFFRIGEFYELFDKDAIYVSQKLGLFLTTKKVGNGEVIAMCGVPAKSRTKYLFQLLALNNKIAVVEEIKPDKFVLFDSSNKENDKKLVNREVVQVFTPGTIIDSNLIYTNDSTYVFAVLELGGKYFISIVDVVVGFFGVLSVEANLNRLISLCNLYNPREIVFSNSSDVYHILKKKLPNCAISTFEFQVKNNKMDSILIISSLSSLAVSEVSNFNNEEIEVIRLIILYLNYINKDLKFFILSIVKINLGSEYMEMNLSTILGLELYNGFDGSSDSSLFKVLDQNSTPMGSRMLRNFISQPLAQKNRICQRLDAVDFYFQNPELLSNMKEFLTKIGDVQRVFIRVLGGKYNYDDLFNLFDSIVNTKELYNLHSESVSLLNNFTFGDCTLVYDFFRKINNFNNVCYELCELLFPLRDDGNYGNVLYLKTIEKINYHFKCKVYCNPFNLPALSRYLNNIALCYDVLESFIVKVLPNVPIEKVNIFARQNVGFFLEIDKKFEVDYDKLQYVKSSSDNKVVVTHSELQNIYYSVLKIVERVLSYQEEVVAEKVNVLLEKKNIILTGIDALANLDVLLNFASISLKFNYTKPVMLDNMYHQSCLKIKDGRHPVADILGMIFVSNDCQLLDDKKIWLITGPNMGGKSTYLKQNGIIAIMSHIGCFVPAKYAEISVIDKVLCRIGMHDSLWNGVSSFMNEMLDMSSILNNATENSLCLIDELCAGTSFKEGLCIAANILKYLDSKIKPKVLFATHLHELTNLKNDLSVTKLYSFSHSVCDGNVVLDYKISENFHHNNSSYPLFAIEKCKFPEDLKLQISQDLQQN
jgi:DNA mismatch repair protein MutS